MECPKFIHEVNEYVSQSFFLIILLFSYLDDILVYCKKQWRSHGAFKEVVRKIKGRKIVWKAWEVYVNVSFLRYVVTREVVQVDPKNIEAVK